jgi:hypothetical protein
MRPLTWTSLLRGHYCAALGGGRFAYVERSPVTGGWRARVVRRAGDRVPAASAVRPTLAAAKAWVGEWAGQRRAA